MVGISRKKEEVGGADIGGKVLNVLKGLPIGIGFGMALEKSKVYLPSFIRSQLLMEEFTMLKMFLSASAIGLVVFPALNSAGIVPRNPKPAVALGFGKMGGFGLNVIGGAFLGMGMALGGACPGTVLAQVSAGVESAGYALLGALFGTFIFGRIAEHLPKKVPDFRRQGSKATLDDFHPSGSYVATSLTLAGVCASAVYVAEKYQPSPLPFALSLNAVEWHPVSGGILIGLLQLPALILLKSPLGTSSSYCTLIGSCLPKDVVKAYEGKYIATSNFKQVGIAIGVMTGSYLSTYFSGFSSSMGGNPALQFVGGMFMLLGARAAGGCTSGHGISGIPIMSISSFISVGMMFAGGIGLANILSANGLI